MKNKQQKLLERFNNKRIIRFIILIIIISTNLIPIQGQNTGGKVKKNIKMTNVTVQQLVDHLGTNSKYSFFIVDEQVGKTVVSVDLKNATLREILDFAFQGKNIIYDIKGNSVTISAKKTQNIQKNSPKSEPKKIIGVVYDENHQPLIGASVLLNNSTEGTVTDLNGTFSLVAPDDGQLRISYIGSETKIVDLDGKTVYDISLYPSAHNLAEVVAIGYGIVKKNDATGSVIAIKPDGFNKGSQITAQDALVGKIAGVNVIPGSGAPGSSGTIRIRMGASLSATNDPLIVIDDVPVSSTSINMLNPNDIATFTVLKDASATAIYGSRGSNGVIIITTKKGDSSSGKAQSPKINYSNNFTSNNIIKYADVLSTEEFKAAFAAHSSNPAATLGTASTNWQNQIYRDGFGQDHNISVIGAAKHMPYRVSLGFTDQNGIIKTNNYNRTNLGFNLSPMFLKDHLLLNINMKGSIEKEHPVSTGNIGSAIGFDPTRPVYESYPGNVGLGYYTWMNGGAPISLAAVNPVSDLNLSQKLNTTKRSIGNMAITYKIHGFEDIQLHLNVGYDISRVNYSELIPDLAPSMYTSNLLNGTGRDYSSVSDNKNTLLDFYANYSKTVAKNAINLMGGYGWQRFWYKNSARTLDTKGNEIVLPIAPDLGELYLLSAYGRLNYSYDGKYMLTSTLRADASSRFSPKTRWGYFPSVALAWRASEETFMKNLPVISDLKLRLSYGETGQQAIGSYYQYLPTYTASALSERYESGDTWYTSYRPNGYDPNIKWETTATYNGGLDFGLLKGRVSGSIDIYKRYTTNLLNKIFVPAGSNFTNVISTNIGDMTSKGVELALNFVPIQTKDWNWTLGGNFTWNSSTITKLNIIDNGSNYILTGNAGGSTGRYLQVQMVDQTPYTFFLLKQAYSPDGKPLDGKYIAKDGSVVTSEENSNKYIDGKSSQAPYYYGFSTKVSFRRWELGMNGHGSFGNYIFNYVAAQNSYASLYDSQGVSSNLLHSTLKSGFTQQRLFTDYFLEKGDFFKLDNVTLGYTFPKLWNGTSSLRLSLAVQNVAILTKYSGVDPEIFNGIDNGVYPRPRIYMFGMNLNF